MASTPLITENAPEFRDALPDGGGLIGLDLGTKTIGTAFADAHWRFATAGKTLAKGKFGKDKAAHFGYSAIIASSVAAATQNEFYGLAAAVVVGAAKEGYDDLHRPKHDPSWKDFGADVAGGIVGAKVGGLFIKRQDRGILVGLHKAF